MLRYLTVDNLIISLLFSKTGIFLPFKRFCKNTPLGEDSKEIVLNE